MFHVCIFKVQLLFVKTVLNFIVVFHVDMSFVHKFNLAKVCNMIPCFPENKTDMNFFYSLLEKNVIMLKI